MWKLKGCPKCGGDIFVDKDVDNNWYAQCLQCSYQRELRDIKDFAVFAPKESGEPVGAQKKQ